MGETKRKAPNHLNEWARSSDVRTLLRHCPMDWALSLLAHDEQKANNINFDLGTAFHTIPEEVLTQSMGIGEAIQHSIHVLDELLAKHTEGVPIISGKRSLNPNILARNLERMGNQWWTDYQDSTFVDWEVAVEYDVVVPGMLRTQLDALFSHRSGKEFAIVDWKSGTSTRSDDLQLWIYLYGLRKNGTISDDAEVGLWFYYPWHGEWKKALAYPGDAVIAEMLEETRQRKHVGMRYDSGSACGFTPIPGWYCDYCSVQGLCPVYNNGSWDKVDALWEERQPVLVNMEGNPVE